MYAPLAIPRVDNQSSIAPALCPEASFVEDVVELFFQYFHTSFPSLFHAPSFKESARNGSVPRILFFGVASLAARYSRHSSVVDINPWKRGIPYAEEAERLLNLHHVSLTTIQACVLLGIAAGTEGDPAIESVFFSNAYRMAMILDLPNAPASSPLDREINLRGEISTSCLMDSVKQLMS